MLDLDNALFMMKAVSRIPSSYRWLFMLIAHSLEFCGRLLALFVLTRLLSAEQVLFTVFGLDVTIITIALIIAGLFLSIRNGYAFLGFVFQYTEDNDDVPEITTAGFWRQSIQAGSVLLLMSVDTLVTLMSSLNSTIAIIVIVFLSGGFRLLFVRPLASLILRYQLVNMTVTAFLTLTGLTLIADAFAYEVNQRNFNIVLLILVLSGLVYSKLRNPKNSMSTHV